MEPLNEKYFKQLISKLSGLPGEKNREQIDLRVEALRNKSRGANHAARVVQSLLESSEFFPTVRAIVDACEYTPDDAQMQASRKDCRYCNGDGWRTVDGPYGTSAAFLCSHRAELTEAESRLGVVIPAGIQRLYHQQMAKGLDARQAHEDRGL